MGLGPPVCQHCQVLASYTPASKVKQADWYCQFCGETDITDNTGFNKVRWQQLKENERKLRIFYNFVRGIDSDNDNRNSSKENN